MSGWKHPCLYNWRATILYIDIKFTLEWYHVPALSVLGSIGKKTGKVKEKERGEGKGGKKEKVFTAF